MHMQHIHGLYLSRPFYRLRVSINTMVISITYTTMHLTCDLQKCPVARHGFRCLISRLLFSKKIFYYMILDDCDPLISSRINVRSWPRHRNSSKMAAAAMDHKMAAVYHGSRRPGGRSSPPRRTLISACPLQARNRGPEAGCRLSCRSLRSLGRALRSNLRNNFNRHLFVPLPQQITVFIFCRTDPGGQKGDTVLRRCQ